MKGYRVSVILNKTGNARELHALNVMVDDLQHLKDLLNLSCYPAGVSVNIVDLDHYRALNGEADPCPRCQALNSPINTNCCWCGKALKPGEPDRGLAAND